ncbi:MAG: CaiB/BaiF CoA transferase family protein [Janthinobacterium lividum]
MGPLQGYRIIEMAGLGPGPFAGMLLADMGAEIIRIDRLGEADLGVKRDPRFDVASRGKRSVAVDLKSPEGLKTVLRLIGQADALIEGFRPGVMERLGLGPDKCLEINPGLVFGRITGWGQSGPLSAAAGHDMNYIALTGALDNIGEPGRSPAPPLNLVGDFGGGSMYLAFGIACALAERAKSGRGQVVDAAIVDGVSNLMAGIHGQYAGGYWADGRGQNVLGGFAAPWNSVYETADGRHITICSIEKRFWATLLDKLQIDPATLPDRMDRANWPGLRSKFADIFRSKTQAEWSALLEGTDVCYAPVLTFDEAAAHPHNVARGVFQTHDGVRQPAPAPRLSRTVPEVQGPPVTSAGQHSDAVLADWGFSAAEVAALREGKTVI